MEMGKRDDVSSPVARGGSADMESPHGAKETLSAKAVATRATKRGQGVPHLQGEGAPGEMLPHEAQGGQGS